MSDPGEPTPRNDAPAELSEAPAPPPIVTRVSYRGAAVALGLALIVVAALVATAPYWAPLLPWGPEATAAQALESRLDRMAAAQQQQGRHIEEQAAASKAAVQRIDQRLSALETKPAAPQADIVALRQDQAKASAAAADLANRVAGIEKSIGARKDAAKDTDRRLAVLEQAAKAHSDAASALDRRLAALEKQVQGRTAADAADTGLALATLQIRDAIAAGRPFATTYDALARLSQNRPEIAKAAAPLAATAKTGVAARHSLATRLAALEKTLAESPASPAAAGWTGSLLHSLGGLVTIRRVGQGGSDAGALGAARKALADGDLKAAIGDVEKLSGTAAKAAQPWLQAARQRLAAEDALDHIEDLLLAKLGGGPASSGGAPG